MKKEFNKEGTETQGTRRMRAEFRGDEMVLLLVSLVRAVDARMLQQGPEGFSVDFERLDEKKVLTEDERLLMKLRVAMEGAEEDGRASVNLAEGEGGRLAGALERIETMGAWAVNVLEMSRELRKRLLEPHMNADERGSRKTEN